MFLFLLCNSLSELIPHLWKFLTQKLESSAKQGMIVTKTCQVDGMKRTPSVSYLALENISQFFVCELKSHVLMR
jgi:hypothetical protein